MDDYRLLVENSLGLMCIHDQEGVLSYVSPAAARTLGWTADDGVGHSLREYLAPTVAHLFDDYLVRIREKGQDSGLMLLLARDGSERFWEYRNVMIGGAGREARVLGHAIDVTERVRAQQALRVARRDLEEGQARHQSLVEGAPGGICIHQDGVIRFATRKLAEMHGYDEPAALAGTRFSDLVAPAARDRLADYTAALLRGEPVPHGQEIEHVTRDGKPLWVEAWSTEVSWHDAPAVRVTVIDIAERKRLQARVQQMESSEAVGRLAGGVANELNGLATLILRESEFVYEGLDDEPLRRRLLAIVKGARLTAKLAAELLAFSSSVMLRLEPLSLSEIVRGLAPHIQALLPPTVTLECRAPQAWPVEADRAQVEGAIMHLVANARDAMPDGGRLEVGVANVPGPGAGDVAGTEVTRSHVAITVRDTGQGIAPEKRAHLFEPFAAPRARDGRTGLGLPSVYGIVKQHGGYVEIDSTPGQGTVVQMFFPRASEASRPATT